MEDLEDVEVEVEAAGVNSLKLWPFIGYNSYNWFFQWDYIYICIYIWDYISPFLWAYKALWYIMYKCDYPLVKCHTTNWKDPPDPPCYQGVNPLFRLGNFQ